MKPMTTFLTTRTILAAGLLFTAVAISQAQNPVTFRVNMSNLVESASFDPNTHIVEVRGDTMGWGPGIAMTPTIADTNIYEATYDYTAGPVGSIHEAKFWYGTYTPQVDNWESINNRQLKLAGGAQTMPTDFFNANTWPAPTNLVTFQVDMTAQILFGNFTNDVEGSYVRVSGGFNGWNFSEDFTHDTNAPGSLSNIYRGTLEIVGFPGSYPGEYKFRAPIGDTWESFSPNRPSFQLSGEPEQILPIVFYNNANAADLLSDPTTVTFRLYITNGTIPTDNIPFNKGVDRIYINGDFLNWLAWAPGSALTDAQEMTNNPPGSDYYEQTFVLPSGNSVSVTYKYSIEKYDNEAGFATNHVRYVRTLPSYTFPVDAFGQQPALQEQSFGELAVGAPVGDTVPVTWLGRPGVTLQTRDSLTAGTWQNLPATSATSATNYPNGGGEKYFRLFHP